MPELLVDFITSLDGYGAATAGPAGGASKSPSTSPGRASSRSGVQVLMGATTYRLMSGLRHRGRAGTDALAGCRRSSSRPRYEPLSWPNTQLDAGDAVEAVRDMKEKASESMRTMGSLTLCRLSSTPVSSTGSGWSSFPSSPEAGARIGSTTATPMCARMIRSRTFDGRIQLLEYVPTVLAGPPGLSSDDA